MEILSTNKPKVQKKPEPKIEYNDRTYQSYIETGFEDEFYKNHGIRAPRDRILKFLNECDIRKGPIERTITAMYRLKAIDWNSPKHEKKEFIYYEERWTAVDFLGIPIENPIDGHIEGKYHEVITKPKLDKVTGEHIDNIFNGTREVYYIPWTKANADEIIEKSAHSDKSNILFVVKFGSEDSISADNMAMTMSMRNQFSYDLFMWPWDKLYEWQTWPIDEISTRPKVKKSATKLEFKPS